MLLFFVIVPFRFEVASILPAPLVSWPSPAPRCYLDQLAVSSSTDQLEPLWCPWANPSPRHNRLHAFISLYFYLISPFLVYLAAPFPSDSIQHFGFCLFLLLVAWLDLTMPAISQLLSLHTFIWEPRQFQWCWISQIEFFCWTTRHFLEYLELKTIFLKSSALAGLRPGVPSKYVLCFGILLLLSTWYPPIWRLLLLLCSYILSLSFAFLQFGSEGFQNVFPLDFCAALANSS